MKTRDLPLDGRPRERLAKYCAEALSNVELLAILPEQKWKAKGVKDLYKWIKELSESYFP